MSLLPTQKEQPKTDLFDHSFLFYGAPKVGKTSFVVQWPETLVLATEPGAACLERYEVSCPDYDTFTDACAEIAAGDHKFKTISIDTIENLALHVESWVCREHNVKHINDLAFGKGTSLVTSELHRVLTKLAHLSYGLVLISHAGTQNVKTRTAEYKKVIPCSTLNDKVKRVITGFVDVIGYIDVKDSDTEDSPRYIRFAPTRYIEAGSRVGRLPDTLDLPGGRGDTHLNFEAFRAAFETGEVPKAKTKKEKA